ncbi:hypothetical protein ROZALSC1DRAFT_28477 [Rozella allomycis CSF55]|uniref:Mitochondrial fission 1 protein n=1 Tax=Rozella allomycis (strain CSF55) TaxID=988480 RepID=A0A075ASC4_ROZAC|nr:hypothetical protein O9G_001145 [Rozella allomycis CSF55]RKP19980.1 hypothetical protein ROZALSC1DRAFT_28477 [Rozella allomycis CSF55]|eukprot:EPZ33176.1 hypothetical protein O9G_001145 [Rozella allomycis CSF55]
MTDIDVDSNFPLSQITEAKQVFQSQQQNFTPYLEFAYCSTLIHSPLKQDQLDSYSRLKILLETYVPESDVYFQLAKVCIRLQEYKEAKKYCLLLQKTHPEQSNKLLSIVNDRVQKDGLMGMMLVAGVGAAVVSGLAFFKALKK